MTAKLVYLFGYPGVGKNTIAQTMAAKSDYVAIQNHLISNAFRHVLAGQNHGDYAAVEPLVKHHTMKGWLNFLDFVEAAAPTQNLVFTSVLYQDDPDRVQFYEFIARWAMMQHRTFIPVRLRCDADEIKFRVQGEDRTHALKLTDPTVLEKLMQTRPLLMPRDLHFLDVDTTHLSADETARLILDKVASI